MAHNRVFVSNEHGGSETVLDARTGTRVATIDLGGQAGNVAVDPVSGMVLVDVQTADEVDTINPLTLQIVERTRLSGCDDDHGLLVVVRAQAITVSRCTSKNAHRSTTTSIAINPFRFDPWDVADRMGTSS